MKQLTFVLIMFISNCIISQTIDSTSYHWYKTDKNIDSIKYIKDYYNNENIKSEGWYIYFNKDNSVITFRDSSDRDCFTDIETKVDTFKHYSRNGTLDYMQIKSKSLADTTYEINFNKNGDTTFYAKYILDTTYNITCPNFRRSWYDEYEFLYYTFNLYSNGIIIKQGYKFYDPSLIDYYLFYDKKGVLKRKKSINK